MTSGEIGFAVYGAILATIGFGAVVVQLRKQNELARQTLLQLRYQSEAQMCQIVIDHPELFSLYVGAVRHGASSGWDVPKRRMIAMCDLVMDQTELLFLSLERESPELASRLVKRRMGNPELRGYWRSAEKGSFDRKFSSEVELAMHSYLVPSAESGQS
jgi:hypothetical protein